MYYIVESYVMETNYYCNDTYLMSSKNLQDAKKECGSNANCNNFHDVCNQGRAFQFCKDTGYVVQSNCSSTLYRKGNVNTLRRSYPFGKEL